MKTILAALGLLASLSLATTPVPPPSPDHRQDSARFGSDTRRDSIRLPVLPDSLKAKIEMQNRDFEHQRIELSKDSARKVEAKVALDSLRKVWEAKRDTQIAHIKDSAVRAKVGARVEKVSAHKAAVKAKVDAKKAAIEAKRAVKPEAPATK